VITVLIREDLKVIVFTPGYFDLYSECGEKDS